MAERAKQVRRKYVVFQVLDEDGQVDENFNKDRIEVVAISTFTGEVLEAMENTPGAFYKSV